MQILNLRQDQLQQLLPLHQIQMPPDLGILARKAVQPAPGTHVLAQLGLDLSGKPHIKVVQHLDVQEEDGGAGQLGGDGVEEDLRAVVAVFRGAALAGFGGENAQADDVGAVAEEDGFSACDDMLVSLRSEMR